MNTASYELCRTLRELSGWHGIGDVLQYWVYQPNINGKRRDSRDLWRLDNIMRINMDYGVGAITDTTSFIPGYDLGFLLRKLPAMSYVYKHGSGRGFSAKVTNLLSTAPVDTPEDAAAKLAIELFKQGILTSPNAT